MLHSMTAFARADSQTEMGTLVWEVRTVNHRFLELAIRLPEPFRHIEGAVREKIAQFIKRGKVDCQLKYQAGATNSALTFNTGLVKQLADMEIQLKAIWPTLVPADPMSILNWPGVLQVSESNMDVLHGQVIGLLERALHDLVAARSREGQELAKFIDNHLQQILLKVADVKQRLPIVLLNQREKLLTRLSELSSAVNQDRLEQEILLFAQKIDVSEEIERLQTHVNEVKRLIQAGGSIGRQLDFFMQELNREANTLGAKSVDAEITHVAVALKLLIEQIREQVQNIE